jgi:hypothetical protein
MRFEAQAAVQRDRAWKSANRVSGDQWSVITVGSGWMIVLIESGADHTRPVKIITSIISSSPSSASSDVYQKYPRGRTCKAYSGTTKLLKRLSHKSLVLQCGKGSISSRGWRSALFVSCSCSTLPSSCCLSACPDPSRLFTPGRFLLAPSPCPRTHCIVLSTEHAPHYSHR